MTAEINNESRPNRRTTGIVVLIAAGVFWAFVNYAPQDAMVFVWGMVAGLGIAAIAQLAGVKLYG